MSMSAGQIVPNNPAAENSFDLLRLIAAASVLVSHQFFFLGLDDPGFLGLQTWGGAGVTVFFFLSGMLVWTSWFRDPHVLRFIARRALRIFPALWLIVLSSVFLVGPVVSNFTASDYFFAPQTWRYLTTALLLVRYNLPGVFLGNDHSTAVNGSLWTLPVEFLCYLTVIIVGSTRFFSDGLRIALVLFGASGLTLLASGFLGNRFAPHAEMIAVFWWGAFYGYVQSQTGPLLKKSKLLIPVAVSAFLIFALVGPRSLERGVMIIIAAALVHIAAQCAAGARITRPLGDLSYGVYIFAFPVQQILLEQSAGRVWHWSTHLALSFGITFILAFASWHLIEKQALRFKPIRGVENK